MSRLDTTLVGRGLARSRGHARDLVDHGVVSVNGERARKPALDVSDDDLIEVEIDPGTTVLDASWVSRAAAKLLGAFDDLPHGGPQVAGRRAADIGACTGGFTQVLLHRGASEVMAVDVGHDQLAPELRDDPRVTDLSGHNARELTPDQIGGHVDLVVADLSFISLTLVIPALAAIVRPGGDLLLLIKPQFEVGRRGLDGRGIVREGPWRARALEAVARSAHDHDLVLRALVPSRTPGQDGNREYVAWLTAPLATDVSPSWEAVTGILDHGVDPTHAEHPAKEDGR